MTIPIPAVSTPTSEGESLAARRVVSRAILTGLWVWPTFLVLDAFMCFVAYPHAPFAPFVAYRVTIELGFYGVYRAARGGRVEPTSLYYYQNLLYGGAALAIALMAVHLGGIRSPYMHGISVVAFVRAALVPTHWRHALRTYARIGLAFPLVMGLGALISPMARAEWMTSASLIVFASNYVFVLASCVLGVVTGHLVWRAQEQLYRARRVGRYRLEAPIGRGGMGEVWLAWDQTLHRNVALKILRAGTETTPEAVRRFELEASAAGRLRGPHVAQVFDVGASDDGLYYIAMEYLAGLNLGRVVEEFGPLPPARAIRLVMQACLALEEAHAAGVIHRDIKPHNLFLTRTSDDPERVKLLDFGIARLRAPEPGDEDLTWTGVIVGTPAYLAPELWRGVEADERSDLYALGMTLYYMLTGATPFDALPLARLQELLATSEPFPLRLPGTSEADRAIEAVVQRCLARSPGDRIQSARELREALAALFDPGAWTRGDAERFWNAVQQGRFGWKDHGATALPPQATV